MYRVANGTELASKPTPPTADIPGGYFGNTAEGGPTHVDSAWLNRVQEEIIKVISAAGLSLDPADNTQLWQAILKLTRIKLTASTSFFVNASTGNDSNTGLTSGSPWLTLQHAWNYIRDTYDLGGQVVTINCAGAYTAGLVAFGPLTGQQSSGSVVFNGTGGASVAVSGAGLSSFAAQAGAKFSVQNFTLAAGGGINSQCLETTGGGSEISVGVGITFNASTAHMSNNGGTIFILNGYTIAGSAQEHMQVLASGGVINFFPLSTGTIILTGTPAFSNAFAIAENGGCILCNAASVAFSGSATGPRYLAAANGVINTQGGGASFLPGSSAGTATTGFYG